MYRILMFIALTAGTCVSLVYLALILRVVMGLFSDGSGIFASFIYAVTEPVLCPIRRFFSKMELFEDVPFDISLIVAMLILSILPLFLPAVY